MGNIYTQLSYRERRSNKDWWHVKVPAPKWQVS